MRAVRHWATRNAGLLQRRYGAFEPLLSWLEPLARARGARRLEQLMALIERAVNGFLFDCQMCGQGMLSASGMSCPMNCPERLRNGPCGGVRADGTCEVHPHMRCLWVEGWHGSRRMGGVPSMVPNPPLDHRLAGTSSWLRVITSAPSAEPPEPAAAVVLVVSSLQSLLASDGFAVTAEIAPPDSADPEEVGQRLRLEEARDPPTEGRRICVELSGGLRRIAGVAGVHTMAPKQEGSVAEIVAESGALGRRAPLFRRRPTPPATLQSALEGRP